MIVVAHAIFCLAFSSQLCGFVAANLFWCRRLRQQRILISHVLRRSCSKVSFASQEDPCPWIGLLILLADPILPDHRFVLMFPVANNHEVLFQLLYALSGDRVLFKHSRRYYNILQGGMDVAPSFPKAYDVLLGTPGALLDQFSPDKGIENSNSNISKKLLDHNNIICLQEVHGKDEFLQAIQVLAPRFRLFGTFLPVNEMREDRLSASTGIFFLKTQV